MTIDISITLDEDGNGLVHRPDCPMVERYRREGRPIMTMLGCKELPKEFEKDKHACLLKQ